GIVHIRDGTPPTWRLTVAQHAHNHRLRRGRHSPDGTLLVRWELEGEPVAVDVATGSSPDHLDHQHETTVPSGQTTLRLPGHPGGRPCVSVAPHGGGPAVVVADRRVLFEGVTNSTTCT